MAIDVVATKMTAEALLNMPDDGYRYELIKGKLRQMAPSGSHPGDIALRISWRLAQYVEENHLGKTYAAETGFMINTNPDTVRASDLAFVSRDRIKTIGDSQGFFPGSPDLAVEVISPNDTYTEVEEKALDWLRSGTQMVVVIDPRKQTATVYRDFDDIAILTQDQVLDGGDIVPGWTLPLAVLF